MGRCGPLVVLNRRSGALGDAWWQDHGMWTRPDRWAGRRAVVGGLPSSGGHGVLRATADAGGATRKSGRTRGRWCRSLTSSWWQRRRGRAAGGLLLGVAGGGGVAAPPGAASRPRVERFRGRSAACPALRPRDVGQSPQKLKSLTVHPVLRASRTAASLVAMPSTYAPVGGLRRLTPPCCLGRLHVLRWTVANFVGRFL